MTTTDEKRQQLRKRVEAGEQRNAERSLTDYAQDAGESATSFIKRHPFATVIGGLALGAIVASIVPGPGRRLRKQATRRGALMATLLTDAALAYGSSLLDSAGDAASAGRDRLGDFGETLGEGARSLRREAGDFAESAGDSARALRQEAGRRASRTIRDLRARMSH